MLTGERVVRGAGGLRTCFGSIGPVMSSRLRSSCASIMGTMLAKVPILLPGSSAAAVKPIDLVGIGCQHLKTSETSEGKLLCWGKWGPRLHLNKTSTPSIGAEPPAALDSAPSVTCCIVWPARSEAWARLLARTAVALAPRRVMNPACLLNLSVLL